MFRFHLAPGGNIGVTRDIVVPNKLGSALELGDKRAVTVKFRQMGEEFDDGSHQIEIALRNGLKIDVFVSGSALEHEPVFRRAMAYFSSPIMGRVVADLGTPLRFSRNTTTVSPVFPMRPVDVLIDDVPYIVVDNVTADNWYHQLKKPDGQLIGEMMLPKIRDDEEARAQYEMFNALGKTL